MLGWDILNCWLLMVMQVRSVLVEDWGWELEVGRDGGGRPQGGDWPLPEEGRGVMDESLQALATLPALPGQAALLASLLFLIISILPGLGWPGLSWPQEPDPTLHHQTNPTQPTNTQLVDTRYWLLKKKDFCITKSKTDSVMHLVIWQLTWDSDDGGILKVHLRGRFGLRKGCQNRGCEYWACQWRKGKSENDCLWS